MKKILTLCLVALAFLLPGNTLHAQYRNTSDSSTVIIFNDPSKKNRSSNREDNIIKIAPLGFLSGVFPLLYERRINDFLSVQVGAGLTHRNFVRQVVTQGDDVNMEYPWPENENYTDLSSPIYDFEYRKAKPGFTASVQPRIYFDDDAMEGTFMGLSFDYYRYIFSVPGVVIKDGGSAAAGALHNESESIKDFMVHFGYQTLYDKITFEYTAAVGLRSINGNKYVAWQDYNGNLIEGTATYKQNPIAFNIGIKVGYHF